MYSIVLDLDREMTNEEFTKLCEFFKCDIATKYKKKEMLNILC